MTIAALQALIDEEIPGIRRLPAPRPHATRRQGGKPVDTNTAVAVSMYKNGETVATITEATGLAQAQIAAAITSSGVPYVADREVPTPPLVPRAAAPVGAEGLIAWGMQHTSARMRRLAEQARTALADLQQAQRREAVVAAAEDRVRQAKQQLADAEQALRTAKATTTPSSPASTARPDKAEGARIRAWAREMGHHVGTAGIIPRHLVDAYRTAHQEAERAA